LENEYCLNHYNKSLNEIKEEHKETLWLFFKGYIEHKKWIEKYRESFSNKLQGDGTAHGECIHYLNLIKDIENNGIKEPIIIVNNEKGKYIKDGWHRLIIAKLLEHETIKYKEEK
jgi:hypothetical protein